MNTMLHQTAAGEPTRVLSSRERQVLQLLAEGRTSKQMAARLDVSVATIESTAQVMDKLDIRGIPS